MKRSRYSIVPISRPEAFDFICAHHRHHRPPVGDKFRLGAVARDENSLLGVVIIGRPVARGNQDGRTLEVTRMCVLPEQKNLCSFLYGAAARLTFAAGYSRLITYTLASEPGASLRGSGWTQSAVVKGRSWSCPSRPRTDKHPTTDKLRWEVRAS